MGGVEFRISEVFHADEGIDAVVLIDLEQILDGTSLAVFRHLGDFIHLQPVAAALLGEEEHVVMVGCRIDILDEVLVARGTSLGADSSAVLGAEFAQRRALDISEVGDGDDHGIVGIEILGVEVAGEGIDLGAAFVAVFVADFGEFLFHHAVQSLFVVENLVVESDHLHQLVVFCAEFLHFQTGELAESHLDNRPGLELVEFETLGESLSCLVGGLAAADDMDHLVDIVGGNHQSL